MAGPFDLTSQNIENTYQRVLQTPDGVNVYDGTGSAFTFTAVAAAGGSDTQIQFNSASLLSGSSNLKFDYTNNNVILTGSILMSGSSAITGVDYIDFDTTATIATSVGRLHWNDVDGTLELGLKGGVVSSELGQGLVTRVVNKTSPLIDLLAANYQVVVIGGAQGQRLSIRLAQADNDANSAGTLGVVAENIDRNQEGFVITVGLLKNRNTTGALQGETWNDGDILYLSPTVAGQMTNIKPQAPQHTVIVGYVEYAHQNNGKIYVKIDNGYELDELHNVRITTASLTAGQLLVRSGSNNGGVWINSNQLTGSYGLTGSLTATSFTGSLFGTASWAQSASQALTASFVPNTFIQGGNSFGATALLGTNDTQDLAFETNGSTRMFVSSSGNVGIGITTPSASLHISSSQENGVIIEANSLLTASAALRITQTGTGSALIVEDATNPDSSIFVVRYDGKVGIGYPNSTTGIGDLGFPLSVNGTIFSTDFVTTTGQANSLFPKDSVNLNLSTRPSATTTNINLQTGNAGGGFAFTRMIVSSSGDVSILSGSLIVSGSVFATSSWANSASQALTASYFDGVINGGTF